MSRDFSALPLLLVAPQLGRLSNKELRTKLEQNTLDVISEDMLFCVIMLSIRLYSFILIVLNAVCNTGTEGGGGN